MTPLQILIIQAITAISMIIITYSIDVSVISKGDAVMVIREIGNGGV